VNKKKEFLHDRLQIINQHGGFPPGRFSYPFRYNLPPNLPGVYYFKEHDVIAKVQYKIKAVLDVHGRDLICKQHLYIHERLDMSIVPRHHSKSKEVLTLCCIPRGKITCESWVDKNAYQTGEVAQIHVNVNNESTVDLRHFNSKLVQTMVLRAQHHTKTIRTIVALTKYDGILKQSKKGIVHSTAIDSQRSKKIHSTINTRRSCEK